MVLRSHITALCLLVASLGMASAGGGNLSPQTAAPLLNQAYTGGGFTLSFPGTYTARSFEGGVALVASGRGDAVTASVLPRPANARALSAEAYARQFGPLNIQGAGALLSFERLTLSGGRSAWVGTWQGSGSTSIGPLYLVPLDPGAQQWLMLSAATPADRTLLGAVARSVRTAR